jgi:hypothetical protein
MNSCCNWNVTVYSVSVLNIIVGFPPQKIGGEPELLWSVKYLSSLRDVLYLNCCGVIHLNCGETMYLNSIDPLRRDRVPELL